MIRFWRFGLLFLLGAITVLADGRSELQHLVVPLDTTSPVIVDATAKMKSALHQIHPSRKGVVHTDIFDGSRYILHGDLFRNGCSYALFDLDSQEGDSIGFAAWTKGLWHLQGLWRIPATWRPEGWKASESDYLPATPADKPFWLQDFDGDGIPELVVAGDVQKYYQQHYLLHFDNKMKRLDLVGSGRAAPEKVERYTRLYSNWGRRAIYEEWEYDRWKHGRLVPVACWHEETPYNNIDPPFQEAVRYDREGKEKLRLRFTQSDDDRSDYVVNDGALTAQVRIRWHDGKVQPTDADVSTYFFEKGTGLPRTLYPEANGGMAPPMSLLENDASITVTGSKSIVRLLQPRLRRKN